MQPKNRTGIVLGHFLCENATPALQVKLCVCKTYSIQGTVGFDNPKYDLNGTQVIWYSRLEKLG